MTQILDPNDPFDLGPTTSGSRLADWIGCLPDSGAFNRGYLTDAYSSFAGAQGVNGAVASSVKITGTDTSARAWLHRREYTGSVRVGASFFMLPQGGITTALNIASFGVIARYQGGSISGTGTTDVHLLNGSCYMMTVEENKTTFVQTIAIIKVASGVQSTLASLTQTVAEQSAIDWFKPFELILEVSGTSTVSLSAKLKNVDLAGGGELGEVTLLTASDSTSPISADGRAGFIMASPRTETIFGFTSSVADVCEWFEVSDQAAPSSVYFRDEWERLGPHFSDTYGPDTLGQSGLGLQGAFSSDQFAFTGTTSNGTGAVKLRFDAAGEDVRFTGTGSGIEQCVSLSQRPAGDQVFQHRSATVNLASSGSGRQFGGILLRGSWSDPVYAASPASNTEVPMLKGYLALAQYNAGTNLFIVQLFRYSGATSGTPLKCAELVTGTPLWTAGADFTLDFDIYPVDGSPDPNNAPVEMVVTINAAAVGLLGVGANGITVSGAGVVIDSSSGKVAQGQGEGLVMIHASGSVTTTTMDDWTEETLHVAAGTPPNDQATIAVQGEGTAVGTINDILDPEFGVTVDYPVESQTVPFESGHKYAESLHVGSDGLPDVRRVFSFNKQASTPREHHSLEEWFDDHQGIEGAFNFIDSKGVTIKVAMVEDTLSRPQTAPTVFGTSFQLVELF